WNLGTGKGYSVLDMLKAFEMVSGVSIPYQISERRPGDIANCYADPSRIHIDLGWTARRDLKQMVEDAWRWQRLNPHGYVDSAELILCRETLSQIASEENVM